MPSAAPASRPNAATSPARGDGSARAIRIRNSVAPDHRGCKRNVLGVVEHGAVPRAAGAERDRGDQGGARTRDQPRRCRRGADPADADQRAQDMAQVIGIDRNEMAEQDGGDIEQAAIEIQVLEVEDAEIVKAAGVVGDDQFAVVMLDAFIVGDRVVLEGAQRDHDQRGDQRDGGDIPGVAAREPSYRPAPRRLPRRLRRRRLLRDAGNALPAQSGLGHGLGHLTPVEALAWWQRTAFSTLRCRLPPFLGEKNTHPSAGSASSAARRHSGPWFGAQNSELLSRIALIFNLVGLPAAASRSRPSILR